MEPFIETRPSAQPLPLPNLQSIRDEAVQAGAVDPVNLMFQVMEFDKVSGEFLGVPMRNLGLGEAIEKTARLIEKRSDSHFFLRPVGYVQ